MGEVADGVTDPMTMPNEEYALWRENTRTLRDWLNGEGVSTHLLVEELGFWHDRFKKEIS